MLNYHGSDYHEGRAKDLKIVSDNRREDRDL